MHPGDKVGVDKGQVWLIILPIGVVIEPFFDCYVSMTKTGGGVLKLMPLRPVSIS